MGNHHAAKHLNALLGAFEDALVNLHLVADAEFGHVFFDGRVLNQTLARWSFSSARVGGLHFVDRRRPLRTLEFLADRVRLGRRLGRALTTDPPLPWRRSQAATMLRYAPDRIVAVARAALRDPDVRADVLVSGPVFAAGLGATLAGAGAELARRAVGR